MSDSLRTLLLVEDNEDDIFLMRRALKATGFAIRLEVAMDGQQAVDYLAGMGMYQDRHRYPAPFVLFLDLKLPYLHGFDVLARVRSDPGCAQMPVIILTSSAEEGDRQKARELGAAAYLVKPPRREELAQVLKGLVEMPLMAP